MMLMMLHDGIDGIVLVVSNYSLDCRNQCCLVLGFVSFFFFFQAEDGIRDLVRSRGLGRCV